MALTTARRLATAVAILSCTTMGIVHAESPDPRPVKSETTEVDSNYYAEVPTEPTERSAVGEASGPGPNFSSRVFVYVHGSGLHADYAQVGYRADAFGGFGTEPVCGGTFDIIWTDRNGNKKSRSGGLNSCTSVAAISWPGHYRGFNMSKETFKANTKVCGRYHLNFGTSPWACITMKP